MRTTHRRRILYVFCIRKEDTFTAISSTSLQHSPTNISTMRDRVSIQRLDGPYARRTVQPNTRRWYKPLQHFLRNCESRKSIPHRRKLMTSALAGRRAAHRRRPGTSGQQHGSTRDSGAAVREGENGAGRRLCRKASRGRSRRPGARSGPPACPGSPKRPWRRARDYSR